MNKTLRHAFLACGLAVCALSTAMASAMPVRLLTVEQAPHAVERQIPGRIEAIHTVAIRARTEGIIEKMHFREGSTLTPAICCLNWTALPNALRCRSPGRS